MLQEARQKMELPEPETAAAQPQTSPSGKDEPRSAIARAGARCWALLLTRIYECLPLCCP